MNNSIFLDSDDNLIFKENYIENADKISYSKHNLIIGENGSGKTRFLKSLEKLRKIDNSNEIILTLYFPEILSLNNKNINSENTDDQLFMFDVLRGNEDINYKDFLKIMESAQDRFCFIKDFFKLTKTEAPKEHKKAIKTLDEFNKIFVQLVNRKFEETPDDILVNKYCGEKIVHSSSLINAFNSNEISPGELMLFNFVLFLYFIEITTNKNLIVIIDEPEQHLHPQKQIYLIKRLMISERISELWVATHSLFLVPLFEFEGLVLIENSCILERSSYTYKNTFKNLVGLENVDIFEFLKSINSWQYYKFILECFDPPKSKDIANKKDEQFRKTIERLKETRSGKPLQVLDYGAGKCRIWDCLKLEYCDDDLRLSALLEYTAYEPYPEKGFTYDTKINIIKNQKELENYNKTFDVIILMNVLHEIPIKDWIKTFKLINGLLKEDGVLFLLEVKNLANGEQPYGNNGYLILGEEQVSILFDNINNFNIEEDDKSNMWTINKTDLNNVSDFKIKKSIESLLNSTEQKLKRAFIDKIKQLPNNNEKNIEMPARKYAFLSQQYINAKFALDLLSGEEKILSAEKKQKEESGNIPPPPIGSVHIQ